FEPTMVYGCRPGTAGSGQDLMLAVSAALHDRMAGFRGIQVDQRHSHAVVIHRFDQSGDIGRKTGAPADRIEVAKPAEEKRSTLGRGGARPSGMLDVQAALDQLCESHDARRIEV